jgi:hypothetical protein
MRLPLPIKGLKFIFLRWVSKSFYSQFANVNEERYAYTDQLGGCIFVYAFDSETSQMT